MDSSAGSLYNSCCKFHYKNAFIIKIMIDFITDLGGGDMDNISFNRSTSMNRSIGLKSRANFPDNSYAQNTPAYQNIPVRSNEKIDSWFYGIVSYFVIFRSNLIIKFFQLASRQFVANKALFIFTAMMLLIVSILVRVTIWKPVDSIVGEFMMLLNWKFYALLLVTSALYGFGYGYYAFGYIFSRK